MSGGAEYRRVPHGGGHLPRVWEQADSRLEIRKRRKEQVYMSSPKNIRKDFSKLETK